ncbi:MAG: 4-(cytidine 5'-diphospho)-2-C-methyl-D-erythritol kinase [Pseudomonadota bacterium]
MAANFEANAYRLTAHAKINLCLHVTGQRHDGYHLIDSLVGFAAFGDTVFLQAADGDSLTVSGPYRAAFDELAEHANSVARARDWLREEHAAIGQTVPPIAIELDKQLPIASGVGGGSADAAATLTALALLWRSPPALLQDHTALAAALGADVPMCLNPRPVRVRGIGDEITPWHRVPMLPCVLVNPGEPVSTPAVFGQLKTRRNAPIDDVPPLFERAGALAAWLDQHTRNDLQTAAQDLCPAILPCLDALKGSGAVMARMSGSGATCFGIYETTDEARAAAQHIAQSERGWFVQATAILPSPPLQYEDYPQWAESMTAVRSLH